VEATLAGALRCPDISTSRFKQIVMAAQSLLRRTLTADASNPQQLRRMSSWHSRDGLGDVRVAHRGSREIAKWHEKLLS
jgi:hypothetical protein